jgi:membrane associated rhomboid family serine protease
LIVSNPYDRARDARALDAWVTITIAVSATVLSVMRFQGSALAFLITDWRGWPQNAWTLGTSTLLHADYLHLAFNVFWLVRLGALLEAIVPPVPFVGLVLALAFGPIAAQYAVSGPGIGLSGLVYGLWGTLWALDRWHPAGRGLVHPGVNEMFVAWFFLCIVLTHFDIFPVANTAHGMGAVLGALFGWAASKPRGARLLPSLALPGAVLASLALAFLARPYVNRSEGYAQELFEQGYELSRGAERAREDARRAEAQRLFAEARDRYRAALERDDIPEAWWNLAICLANLGEPGAPEARARARELDPEIGTSR